MATPVVTDPGSTVTTFESHTVEYTTTPTVPASWAVVPWLYCRQLQLAVNAYDQAHLEYLIGLGLHQPGDTDAHDWVPLDIRGKYVRITIPQVDPMPNIVWVGYVLQENLQRDGVFDDGGGNKFQGEGQLLSAVGLEWFLDRKQIDSSIVYPNIRILRALKFNGGESQSIDMKAAHRGNRSKLPSPGFILPGPYRFSDDSTTEDQWTVRDMVEYLLENNTTKDSANNSSPCKYFVNPTDLGSEYLAGFHPTVATERRTVFQILNEIISPQRGLVWWLEFDSTATMASPPAAYIRVNTLATDDISLSDASVFPENGNQITLDFDTEVDVKIVDLKDIGYRDYHKVTCRGARQTVTMTVGLEDGTLVTDWKDETETAYKDAAKADSDYSDLNPGQKKDRNDALRRTDLFGRVYSYFRIPKTWNGQTSDGGTGEPDYAFAKLSDAGEVDGGLALTAAGIRLLNKTRLKLGVNYKDPKAPVSNAPDGSLEEFLPPFAILKVETSPGILSNPIPNRWQFCEKMEHCQFHAGTRVSPHIATSYNLKMQEHAPGIVIRAAGAPQHTLALNHFFAEAGDAEPSKVKPELDYTDLRATVCAESDNYAEGSKAVSPLPTGVPIEELVVDLGDDFRLDFLAKNTIVDLKSGDPVLASTSALLRDDRPALRDIANIAFQWYRANRNSLTVEFRQLRNLFSLGQMITTIGAGSTQSDVNTVISTLTFDLKTGTTTVHTHDQTLDVRSLYEPRRKQSKA